MYDFLLIVTFINFVLVIFLLGGMLQLKNYNKYLDEKIKYLKYDIYRQR